MKFNIHRANFRLRLLPCLSGIKEEEGEHTKKKCFRKFIKALASSATYLQAMCALLFGRCT